MSFLGRILQGIGSYLVEKGKEDYETAKTELLYNRELALKQLEFQHDDQINQANHDARMSEISATGAENRRTDLFKGVVDERRDIAKSQRDLQHDITIKKIDLMNDKALEAFKTKNHLTEAQYQSLLDTRRDITVNGSKIERVVFSKNGQMQEVYGNGDIVSKGPTGAYNPGGSSDDDFSSLLANSGASGASGSGSTSGTAASNPPAGIGPTPPPAPSMNKAAALAKAGNLYAQAAANPKAMQAQYPGLFDQQGNLLPKDQVIAQVAAQFPGQ